MWRHFFTGKKIQGTFNEGRWPDLISVKTEGILEKEIYGNN